MFCFRILCLCLISMLNSREILSNPVELDLNPDVAYERNCAEVAKYGSDHSGIYEILNPNYSDQSFNVACDMETLGGGWTIILQRLDGSVNFYRNWNTYKHGFGDLDGEFFLGLDKIHALTADESQELLVLLEDAGGVEANVIYEKFAIADESEFYALNILGEASGNAGNSLRNHFGKKFSTFDKSFSPRNCAAEFHGAWWYNDCYDSQLTASYGDNSRSKGISWKSFRSNNTLLKRAVMMIRPRNKTVDITEL